MKISVNSPCPCCSGLKYKKCCHVYHKGTLPKTAQQLMRSRYSAFAVSDYKYIIKTTHEENPDFTKDTEAWRNSILEFCNSYDFENLKILEYINEDEISFVTFKASLLYNGKDSSFTEKSRFYKINGMWKYHSGEFIQ